MKHESDSIILSKRPQINYRIMMIMKNDDTYQKINIKSGQYEHFKMLISMQKHVEQERVLIGVQVKRKHLKQLRIVDAKPRQRL